MTSGNKKQDKTTILTLGTFDLFHEGHLNMIKRAAAMGDKLIVGVATDEYTYRKKNRCPVYSQEQRMGLIRALNCVDTVFFEENFEKTPEYVEKYQIDVLVMGSDKIGEFEYLSDRCKVVYLPRSDGISTTDIIQKIKKYY